MYGSNGYESDIYASVAEEVLNKIQILILIFFKLYLYTLIS
jgi:hypothetical protein